MTGLYKQDNAFSVSDTLASTKAKRNTGSDLDAEKKKGSITR